MREDIKNCIEEFEVKTLGNKRHFDIMEAEIRPNEKIYYIAPTNIEFYHRDYGKKDKYAGVIMISDMRILFISYIMGRLIKNEILPIEVHTVASCGNGVSAGHVSFCAENMRVDFTTAYKKDIYTRVEQVLKRTVEAAVKAYNNNNLSYMPEGVFKTVVCKGCRALNIVKINTARSCEYCGREIK